MSQQMLRNATIAGAAMVVCAMLAAPAFAADEPGKIAGQSPGKVVIQSKGPGVPVAGTVAPLHLTAAQRARIAEVLATQDSEVGFKLKSTKSAKSFEPRVDEKIPKGIKPQAFPLPLPTELPAIRQYAYLKFKGQVLIVNPLTGTIVDMFPEQGV